MPAPLLHSRVRDSIEVSNMPGEVIEKLRAFSGEQFVLKIDDSDYDNIHFKMTRINGEIIIHGVIKRWQGTESRLDFMGEVNVPESNTRLQYALVAVVVLITGIYMFKIAVLDSLHIAPISTTTDLFAILFAWLIPTFIIGVIAFWLIVRDRASAKRWQVQQEMAKTIEQFRKLETYA